MTTRVNPLTSMLVAAGVFAALSQTPALLADQNPQGAGARQGGARQGGQAGAPGRAGRGRGNAPQAPAGPIPRMANGKPDLSGLWANPYTPNMAGRGLVDPKTREPLTFARQGEALPDAKAPASGNQARTFDLPYTEWGLNQWEKYDPVNDGDYAGNCLPFGMSRNINSPHGVQIVHNPDALAFLFEQNTWHHWVPTTPGFKWPEDLPETWNGSSVGHWDGDTLVIETTNFNGYTRLDTSGHPHSKELKLTNTFKRLDSNTMEHTVTVHDPKTYTQDWMNVRTWRIKPAPDVLMEYSCEENNLHSILDGAIKIWKIPEDIE